MVEFVDEPPVKGITQRRQVYGPIVDELKKHPGKWAKCRTLGSPASAGVVADMFKKEFKCEATIRGCDVWASWPKPAPKKRMKRGYEIDGVAVSAAEMKKRSG